MKGTLHIVAGTQDKRTVSLEEGRYTIGRGEEAHIQIASQQVSRKHAEIIVDPSGVTLLDCGSANGTAVNGKFVTTSPLRDGDQILIGEVVLEYRTGAENAPKAGAPAQPFQPRPSFYVAATQMISDRLRPRALWPLFTGVFAISFLAIALLTGFSFRSVLRERLASEALQRAQGLVKFLAEKNREDLKLRNELLLDVDSVLREKGVREATIVNAKKRVLAPISKQNQILNDPFIDEALHQNSDRSIQPGPAMPDGSRVLVHPIRAYDEKSGKYRVLGVARVVFAPEDAVGSLVEADRLLYLMLTTALALALFFGWISARLLVHPLLRLAERIHRWRAGQIFDKETPPYRDFQPLYDAVDQALEESQR